MALVQGTTIEKFDVLREHFESSLANGDDVGASIAVFHHEELVCDLWGGYRDAAKTVAWDRDTLVNVWSTTKTMTFLVALMLCDRGELDFDVPVATYWPEFAAKGKGAVEVRHLMNHTAGLPGWSKAIHAEDLANWDLCVEDLAAQAPWWDDRSRSGYHAATQGFLIGEVVRRITGTTIGQFFKSEVADVLGADFFIGLPESEEHRVSVVIPPSVIEHVPLARDTIRHRTLTSPVLQPDAPRHRWWRAAEIPAVNGHGNAHSVALVQQIIANNGHARGHRFFNETTGDRVFHVQTSGVDQVLDFDVNFGLGYGLASSAVHVGPKTCYWGGFGGSFVIMDQDLQLTVAYMMNKMQVGLVGDTRGPIIAINAAVAAMG
ncbi:MAG TPA: serine hydrolase domain-containing protein [Acidimicrobiales bacterium]|nr:serine hydrolase domain-containing protein [Acidimicrobiales bacterium]